MSSATSVRAAAVQFAVGTDRAANLATCLHWIRAAAAEGAQLIVLPEFCNHASWYDDHAHAIAVAVEPGDDFLGPIATAAADLRVHVMVNATRRAGGERVTGSNFLFGPDGALLAIGDKQVLMGAESDHLSIADDVTPIVSTPLGQLGLYSCMDGVINETPRSLALRGGQILLNSLNSFARDEASLHIPVRAAENRVWVVAANKVGSLIPEHAIAEVARRMGLRVEQLYGAGESQIVAPDGTVIAIAPHGEPGMAIGDIEVAAADDKLRVDGTDIFANRRPELYGPIGDPPNGRRKAAGAAEVVVAVVQPDAVGIDACIAATRAAADGGARLIVLPELCWTADGTIDDQVVAVSTSDLLVEGLANAVAGTPAVVVTSIVVALAGTFTHAGIVISGNGVELTQMQLHASERHAWVGHLGDEVELLDLPWGRLAVVLGSDSVYPEVFRLAALQDVEVVAVPAQYIEAWEAQTGLIERAAENRMCVAVATRPGPLGTSAIHTLENDFTLWTDWPDRAFDGRISHPLTTSAPDAPGVTRALVHPARTANRVLTRRTDLVDSRPWKLADAIIGAERPTVPVEAT